MFPFAILLLLPAHAAMLLVPTVGPGAEQETQPARTATNLMLRGLQLELGGIRVLKVAYLPSCCCATRRNCGVSKACPKASPWRPCC